MRTVLIISDLVVITTSWRSRCGQSCGLPRAGAPHSPGEGASLTRAVWGQQRLCDVRARSTGSCHEEDTGVTLRGVGLGVQLDHRRIPGCYDLGASLSQERTWWAVSMDAGSKSQARLPVASGEGAGWDPEGIVENMVGGEEEGGRGGCVTVTPRPTCLSHSLPLHMPCSLTWDACPVPFYLANPACAAPRAWLKTSRHPTPPELITAGSVPAAWPLPTHLQETLTSQFLRNPGVQCPVDAKDMILETRGGTAVHTQCPALGQAMSGVFPRLHKTYVSEQRDGGIGGVRMWGACAAPHKACAQ